MSDPAGVMVFSLSDVAVGYQNAEAQLQFD